jgi:mono/diheme cytochrome c family protein
MIANILVLLLIAGLAIVFGWLTYRALWARRVWVKIAGGIGAGLLTLLFAAVALLGAVGLGKMNAATALPVPDLKVESTPQQIARGKYIAGLGCVGCHGVNGQFPLAGGTDMAGEIPMPIGSVVTANLTPGGVLNDRSDGELFRAIRQGYGKDGRLLAFMSQLAYRQLSDDDIKAVIAFLRSQEPAASTGPEGDRINLLGAVVFFGAGMLPPPTPVEGVVAAPPKGITTEYGKYTAILGDCLGCHGPQMTGMEASPINPAIPNPRPFVANWTREQFIQVMRTGARPDGSKLDPGMPWQNAAKMTDDDLAALYTYLRAPVQ